MPSVKLPQGKTLLLEGPASVRLEDGKGSILAAPLSNNWLTAQEDRQVPVETVTGAGLEVKLGHGSKYKLVDGSTIPTGWREASQVLRQSPGVVVIVGDVDSGKSTLCTLLANECFRQGLRVGVIDGDIGQADIGPPTTVSSGRLKTHVFSLQDLSPEKSYFIGDTSPSLVSRKLSQNLVRLKEEVAGVVEVLLVNTDGWVRDREALQYKHSILTQIRPDLILGIDTDGDLNSLLELQTVTTLKLSRSGYARTRSKEERKRAREYGYKRFLQNAKRIDLSLSEVKLRRYDSYQQLRLDKDLRGVLAGLLDDEEKLIAIGRIEGLRNGTLGVKTVLAKSPRIVELGTIVLSSTYEEVGYES